MPCLRWIFHTSFLLLLLSASCSRRFEQNFSSVAVSCGAAEDNLRLEDLRAYRPVDAEGRALSIESLEALSIENEGNKRLLGFTTKGCIYVPREFSGVVVFRNKKKGMVGFTEQQPSTATKDVIDIPLENFPVIKPKLLCSGQDVWTNLPFAQVEWEFFRNSQSLSTDEVRHLLPLLDIKLMSRTQNGEVLQELALTRNINVPELSGHTGRFAWQFQVPSDDESQIEFLLQDILGRTDELKGPSACHVHMSTQKPKILTSNDRSLLVKIQQGQNVPLDTFDDAQLFVQIKPITADAKVKSWNNLNQAERATERKEFRPGRSPAFWQTGTYVMRAYTENKAKNQSPVWERVIQVVESPLIDNQISLSHWILQQASKNGGPAIIDLQHQADGPLIRFRSLDTGADETIEVWRPQVSKQAEGIFQSGFNINRQLVEGRFGFGNSRLMQTCILRGSHPSDSWRESFVGRLLCWQRAASGQLEIVADLDSPFMEGEELHAMPVGGGVADEIFSFSPADRSIRMMRVAVQSGLNTLQEVGSFPEGSSRELIYATTVAGAGEPGYMVRSAVGQGLIVLTQIDREPKEGKPVSVADFSFAPSKVDYYTDSWGPLPDAPEMLEVSFVRASTRMQAVSAWKDQYPTMIFSNIRFHSRWARHIFTKEHQSSRLLTEASFAGLPSNMTDTCFFVGMRCIAYHDEPRRRDDVKIYDFDAKAQRWTLQSSIDLKTLLRTDTLQENQRPTGRIVNIGYGSSYKVTGPEKGQIHWKAIALSATAAYPNWTTLSAAEQAQVHEGQGALQLWGRDERFAVFMEVRDAADQVVRTEVRDLRFEGSPLMGADINHGLGLVELKGQGVPYLIQPEAQGFAALELGLKPSAWESFTVPLPDFVRRQSSGLGWNMQPLTFVSGRILPGRDSVFCYAAAAVDEKAGALSCYGWNGSKVDSLLNMEFPLAEGQEIVALQINGSDRTALLVFDRKSIQFQAYVLEPNATGSTYTPRLLSWVRTKRNTDNTVEKIEESNIFGFREGDPLVLTQATLHQGNGPEMEPGILNLGGQLQIGSGNSRFALISRATTSVTGGRLQKADTPELALDMDLDAMDMQPNSYRRLNLFRDFEFTWRETPGAESIFTTLEDRGSYGNLAYSQNVDGRLACRVEGTFDGSFLVTGIANCSPFMMQNRNFTTVIMDTFFDLLEQYLAQPDHIATHWTLPYWIPDPVPTADPRQLPVTAMLLRIPKNYQRDGWIVQRGGYDFPLADQGENWSTLRTFSLSTGL